VRRPPHLVVPTSDTWHLPHLTTDTLAIPGVSICDRLFPKKNSPSEGFKHKGYVSSSWQDQLSAKASIQPLVSLVFYGTLLFAPRAGSSKLETKQHRQVQAGDLEPEIWASSAQLPWTLMGNALGVTTGLSFLWPAFGSRAQSSGYAWALGGNDFSARANPALQQDLQELALSHYPGSHSTTKEAYVTNLLNLEQGDSHKVCLPSCQVP